MNAVTNAAEPGTARPPDTRAPDTRAPDTRDCVAAFYEAYRARDLMLLDAVLHEQVDWLLAGPADHFDFYGARHGKAEVIELITRIIPCYFQITDFELEHVLVQGERVAVQGRLRARQRDTGRSIRYGYAHFLRFEQGRLVSLRGVGDTFDAAEQVVGHAIDVNRVMENVPLAPEDEFSAV